MVCVPGIFPGRAVGKNRPVTFRILGPMEIHTADGDPVSVGGPRQRSLLALLLLEAGRIVTTDRLIDELYGEALPAGVTNALQSQVSRLRRSLRTEADPDGPIEFHPAGYRLAVDPDDVDALRFTRLAGEGRRALAAGDAAGARDLLREALDLWRGPALADVAGAPFAGPRAARLAELRASAIEDHADAAAALGATDALVEELREAVATHPLRERLRAQLMRALHGGGRQAEALAVFDQARELLADELGADPSAELSAVHLAILRGDPPSAARPGPTAPTAAPTPEPARTRSRLPAALTSFVGREDELARIHTLLTGARLVTLLGPGGAGKTRLAVEAASRRPEDAYFVDLAPLAHAGQLPQAVLSALGVREVALLGPGEGGAADPVERLIGTLADRRVLLVLDNCEHLVADVAAFTHRLLGACPAVRIVATSREALAITGESLCPLAPLALAPPDCPPERALDYPAVRLLVDRGAAVRPGFTVDAGTLAPILRVCAALDGLPLAIELAAARLRSLSIDDVALRLGDRFRLLSRGDRTAPARHRTLRAVVEWSWGLLDDTERELALRLPVFAGTFTLDAVVGVCGLDPDDADELLQGLADKSLLSAPGDGRYRLLDTIREFCAERLAESGAADALYAAHAQYYTELARTADPFLRRAEQLVWRDRLVLAHDNLLAALHHSVRTDLPRALSMMSALTAYWWMRGRRSEATGPANTLLDMIGPGAPTRFAPADDPHALDDAYVLCVVYALGASDTIDERLAAHAECAKAMMRGRTEAPRQPLLTYLWAMTTGPGAPETAIDPKLLDADPWSRALHRLGSGYVSLFRGDAAAAEPEFAAAADGFRAVGDRWGLATALERLADFVDWRGDGARADALLDEALDLLVLLDALEDISDLRSRRAARLVRAGRIDEGHAEYERAAETAARAGIPGTLAGAQLGLGEIARLRGDPAEANRLLRTALKGCVSGWVTSAATRGEVLVALGRVAEAEGDARGARARHREALGVVVGGGFVPVLSEAAEGLAGADLLDGDGAGAARLLGIGAALRGVRATGDPDAERIEAGARALIGDEAYAAAFARGAALSREEALAVLGRGPRAAD